MLMGCTFSGIKRHFPELRGAAMVFHNLHQKTSWRVNRITIDSLSVPENTTLDVTELETVPTDGAIVLLRFPQPINN
jgi:hypothetical protein